MNAVEMSNLNNQDSKSIEQVDLLEIMIVNMISNELKLYLLLKGSFCNLNNDFSYFSIYSPGTVFISSIIAWFLLEKLVLFMWYLIIYNRKYVGDDWIMKIMKT